MELCASQPFNVLVLFWPHTVWESQLRNGTREERRLFLSDALFVSLWSVSECQLSQVSEFTVCLTVLPAPGQPWASGTQADGL